MVSAAQLADIQDPPLPQRANSLVQMSSEEARKNTITVLGMSVVLLAGAAWLWQHGYGFWGVVAGVLGLILGISAFGAKSLMAPCPFCSHRIPGIAGKDKSEGSIIQCPQCYQYSIIKGNKAQALDPVTAPTDRKYETPVFAEGVWPRACVACGASATRFDDLTKRNVNALGLLAGRLVVVKGTLSGVPYCDQHHDGVELTVTQSKKLLLSWTSLRMMRRYLAANRNRQPF